MRTNRSLPPLWNINNNIPDQWLDMADWNRCHCPTVFIKGLNGSQGKKDWFWFWFWGSGSGSGNGRSPGPRPGHPAMAMPKQQCQRHRIMPPGFVQPFDCIPRAMRAAIWLHPNPTLPTTLAQLADKLSPDWRYPAFFWFFFGGFRQKTCPKLNCGRICEWQRQNWFPFSVHQEPLQQGHRE